MVLILTRIALFLQKESLDDCMYFVSKVFMLKYSFQRINRSKKWCLCFIQGSELPTRLGIHKRSWKMSTVHKEGLLYIQIEKKSCEFSQRYLIAQAERLRTQTNIQHTKGFYCLRNSSSGWCQDSSKLSKQFKRPNNMRQ